MTTKYHSDTQERIEQLAYSPGVQDTGDLEADIRTITATAEASGLANADYTISLTLPRPGWDILEVLRVASRLSVTIDSFDGATHLYCRIYVDAQDTEHRLFDMDFTDTGEKLTAVDTYVEYKATIFNLLHDGGAHTFYFFFWVDQANNAVISAVRLWEAVGTCSTSLNHIPLVQLTHTGLANFFARHIRIGSGSSEVYLAYEIGRYYAAPDNSGYLAIPSILFANTPILYCRGTVATDLNYVHAVFANLKNAK